MRRRRRRGIRRNIRRQRRRFCGRRTRALRVGYRM